MERSTQEDPPHPSRSQVLRMLVAAGAVVLSVVGCSALISSTTTQFEQIPVSGFTPIGRVAAVLSDGRYLIRGQWDDDDEMFHMTQQPGDDEPTILHEPPVRLFVVDPESAELTPLSGVPETREINTLLGRSVWPDEVLLVWLSEDERTVQYELGFTGGAYDIPYETRVAAIPQR